MAVYLQGRRKWADAEFREMGSYPSTPHLVIWSFFSVFPMLTMRTYLHLHKRPPMSLCAPTLLCLEAGFMGE